MTTTVIITNAEMEAYSLVHGRRGSMSTADDFCSMASEAGNRIIELAERVKAQRAVATLNAVLNR